MPTVLLPEQQTRCATLAAAWLAAGATGFSVWQDGAPLAGWPAPPGAADLAVPVRLGALGQGALRVTGLHGAAALARLQADAALLAQASAAEDDLEQMTAELVALQDQLLALYDLTRSTRRQLQIDEVLQTLAETTARLIPLRGAFAAWLPPGAPPVVAQPVPVQFAAAQLAAIALGAAQAGVLAARRPATMPGDTAPGLAVTLLPIVVKDAPQAVLGLITASDANLSAPALKLAGALAEQTGAQLENVLLHQEAVAQARLQREMELAADIQRLLLPRTVPIVAGLDLAEASSAALLVGGDFYAFVQQAARPFLFAVGDVAGKGMGAALLMSMVHTVLNSAARYMPNATPARVLDRLSQDLYGDFTEVSKFATVLVGRYEPTTRQVIYANAGHAPVIYCPCGGPAQLLEADGPPIGVLPVNMSADQAVPLCPGDLLVVGTDGLNEARNAAGELFDYPRLLALVETLAAQPASAIAAGILRAVAEFAGDHAPDDDQTLVVLKGTAG